MQTKHKISAYRLTAIHLHLNCWASPVTQIRWSLLAEKDKIKNILLPLLLIALIITVPMLYKEKAKDERQYELFLNRLYMQLDLTILAIDSDLEIENGERLAENLYSTENRFEKIGVVLDAGGGFVNHDILAKPGYFMHRGIHNIGVDGKIDGDEKEFLLGIRDDLEMVKTGMYSSKTGQEDPNLNFTELNALLSKLEWIGI